MKYTIKLTLLVFIIISSISCENDVNKSMILKDIAIINIQNGQIASNSILIENNFIKQIGSYNELPKNDFTKVIDCNGKYAFPGLFDMHTHISEHDNSVSKLNKFLINGITSIRDMGGIVDTVANIKNLIEGGKVKGPNIYFAGVTLDGPQSNDPFHVKVHDTTDLKALVLDLKNKGIQLFKVHNYFPTNRLIELKELGEKLGLSIAGHIPVGVGPMELETYGIKCVEHMNSLLSSLILKESNGIDDINTALTVLDSNYVSLLSSYYKKNQIAFTPTLYNLDDMYSNLESEASQAIGKQLMERFYEITLWMNQNEVLLLAGSDLGEINNETIDGVHRELETMVKNGFSPLEALKTATINPSKFLNIDNMYGSIQINKKANLVILNSNPLENISNIRDIDFVLKDEEFYRESS